MDIWEKNTDISKLLNTCFMVLSGKLLNTCFMVLSGKLLNTCFMALSGNLHQRSIEIPWYQWIFKKNDSDASSASWDTLNQPLAGNSKLSSLLTRSATFNISRHIRHSLLKLSHSTLTVLLFVIHFKLHCCVLESPNLILSLHVLLPITESVVCDWK